MTNHCSCAIIYLLAVIQYYEVEADNEYVIRGNAAIMKCKIPSYISDFVSVDMWRDTDNNTFRSNVSLIEGVIINQRNLSRILALLIRIKLLLKTYSFI